MSCSRLDLSLNEVEMLAAKAARGAGLAWGLADQVGRSARWLAQQRVAWAASLTVLLQTELAPGSSPFLAGAYLADLAGAAPEVGPVRSPLWAVPPLAAAAARLGRIACAQLGAAEIRIGQRISATHDAITLLALPDAMIRLRLSEAAPELASWPTPASRAQVSAESLAPLRRLAAQTFVPSDERSRKSGAGATRDDD